VLSSVGVGGGAAALRQLTIAREAAAARAQESLATLLADTQAALRREARLLARDPALVDGVAKGDWATVAHGVSPRLAGLTLERVADLVAVLDASGAPLLQVPASPPTAIPDPAAISFSPAGLTVLNGQPYVVAAVPVASPGRGESGESRPTGFVIIARRLESVAPLAPGASDRPGILFLDQGKPMVSTLQVPATEWAKATASGRLRLEGGRDFLVRPASQVTVSGPGRLWILVADGSEGRRKILIAWLVILGACGLISAGAALVLNRGGDPAGRRTRSSSGRSDTDLELTRRNRELEALNAVALSMGRSADVVATAGEMLDVVRALAQMDVGGVHQLDPADGTVTLIAQRGLTPEFAAQIRVRPVAGSYVGEAARTGRLIVTHIDPSSITDPWLTRLQAVRAHRTQLALPIPVKGQTWGVMSLISQEQRDFLPEEVKVLEAVAHQIGQVVERSLLLADMQEQTRRLETLARTGHTLTAARSLEDVLTTVVEAARGLVPDGAARLAIAEGDQLRFCAEAGILGGSPIERIASVALGEGVTGRAAVSRQPVIVELLDAEPGVVGLPWLMSEGFVSAVIVPLLLRERLVGVLNVFTRARHTFVPADMGLLLSFASHAAIAIDNAQLFAEAQQNAARYRALFDVGVALTSSLELDQILDAIVERCQMLTGAQAAGIFRSDAEAGVLTYVRASGVSSEFLRGLRVRLGEGTAGRAIRERTPVWTADVLSDPSMALSADTRILVEREGYHGVLSVPIFIKGEPYGGLSVYWWQPHPVSKEEIEVMTALGSQAAMAIDNARLFADERSGRASLTALLEVNKKIGLLAPTDTLLTGVAEEAMRLLDLDNAGFRLLEGDELVVAGLAGSVPETMLRPRIRVGESLAGKVVAEGRAIIGRLDTFPEMAPEHLAADRRLGYTHFMGLPLRFGERIIGALTLRARRVFSRRDQEVAEAFAGQAAVAIEHARLYREAAQQAERMRALAEMGRTLVSTFDAERILSLVTAQTREALGVAVAAVRLYDADLGMLRFTRHSGLPEDFDGPLLVEPGEGASGLAFSERRPVWTPDVVDDPRIRLRPESRERLVHLGQRAALALPLMRDEPFGTLAVYHETGHRFSQAEIEYLSTVASQLVVALDNARLFEAAEVRERRLRSLARLNQLVSSSLDTDEVLAGIARAAAALMGVPVVSVWVADADAETLRVRAFSDEAMGAAYPRRTTTFEEGAMGWIARKREPLSVPDMLADPRLLSKSWWLEHGLRSFLGVPIVLQDQLLGVLALCGRAPFAFGADEKGLLESFVAQAAVAIRNAGLYAQTAQRLEQTRALLGVAEILNTTLEPRRMLKEVAQRIAQVCRVDRCSLERWEGDRVVPLMSQFADGRKLPELWAAFETMVDDVPREVPIHAQAIETRRPVVVADASETDLIPAAWIEAFHIKSYMVVPLIRQDEVIGVMTLDYTERVTPFEPWQQDLGMAIGNQVALALENQRLYSLVQERLQEATTLLAVSQALTEPEMEGEALRRVAREVGVAFGADMVGVYTTSADKKLLIPAAGWHVPKDHLKAFLDRPFVLERMPVLQRLWRDGHAGWSSDVGSDPRMDQRIFEGLGSYSLLTAPALARGVRVGGVFLVWWASGRQFTSQEIRLIEGIASQVGLFMDNADLTRQTRVRLKESEALLSELSVLHDLSRTVTGQLRQEDVVEAIHKQVARLLDTRHMVLAVVDDASAELVPLLRMREGVRDTQAQRTSIHGRVGLISFVAASGRPIRTSDYAGECARREVEPVPDVGLLPNWIGVPMLVGSQVVGVLALRSAERPFSEADERILTNIAGLAALALRSARLFQDRTRAYEDLAQAQDQLVRSEKLRALGEMASGVAHDFNNLLAAILGRAQLLLHRVEDPKARQWLQIIERSAEDGAKTVRRLQEFTRIRRDQPSVALDLNRVVREALELTESSWRLGPPRRGVSIQAVTELASDLPKTTGDPAELREVMTNLILNAVDAMPHGGTLTLATARRGDSIELRVVDTGVGIPEAVRAKIFDPFFTTKGPKGTGLGLSMTYGILSRHGATIAVESQEGQGTTFTMLFPVSAIPETPVPVEEALPEAVPLRCLVVDDEEMVGDMLADVLRSAGHTVTVARNASEGLAHVQIEPLDLIFTDLSMPGMTGWELARAVRAAVPGLPVILVSGFAVEVSQEELEASGVHSVLAKPINIGDVLEAASTIRPRGEPERMRP
jgi:GAF domain-containing protein/ActR/RegA family two-component response regulator/anti-sigma regulatory factor (Ser/Thr protein kinase)